MGELQTEPFQFTFNGFLKVAFQGSRITSDAGLLLVRELDERLGLATLIAEHLSDSRQGLNTQFSLADLLRQSVYSRLAGYEDLNDAVRVSADPTFRLIGSPTRWDRGGGPAHHPKTSRVGKCEKHRSDAQILGLARGHPSRVDVPGVGYYPQEELPDCPANGTRAQRACRVLLVPSVAVPGRIHPNQDSTAQQN